MSLSRSLGSIKLLSMVIQMNDRELRSLAQLQSFLDGTTAVDFALSAAERYGFIEPIWTSASRLTRDLLKIAKEHRRGLERWREWQARPGSAAPRPFWGRCRGRRSDT